MEGFPKNQESNVGEDTNAKTLTEMPEFEEHMESVEEDEPIDEKYYEQARAERDRWVEASRKDLEKAENLNPNELISITDFHTYAQSGRTRGYRQLDPNNAEDMTKFNNVKETKIETAKETLEADENIDLDKLAKYCKNIEMIKQINEKLKNDEEFNAEEQKFLSRTNPDQGIFLIDKYMTPNAYYAIHHGLISVPTYNSLLFGESKDSEWAPIAKAQMRELVKQDRALLHNNEDVQGSLENMEERRNANPFAGETNINSETGEARTFTLEDNYPRLEGESEEDYTNRLRRIGLKTRLVEKRQ